MTTRRTLENPNERTRAYARGRDLELEQPTRQRPRLGGEAPLPASGAAAELFLVAAEDLSVVERAAAGWCVRLGVPEPVPGTGEYDMHELLVELTVMVGGVAHTIEVNAFPSCAVHLVGEQIAARVKWGLPSVAVPPGVLLRWQLSRGLSPTVAVRAYTVQAPGDGFVPLFATGFALFSGDDEIDEDLALQFLTHPGATRVLQHYTRDDLLQCVGQFTVLPPGASVWRWLEATAEPLRLAFTFGDVLT